MSLLDLIAKRKASVSRVKTLKPNPGRNRYRILPSWRGAEQQFWMDFGQHFIKDATGQITAVYVCAAKTFGGKCEVCDAVNQGIAMSPDDLTKRRLEEAKSNARVLLNVLHLDGPTPNVVQVLEVAPTVFNGNRGVGGIISLFADWPNMLDVAGGAEIVIDKSGTGKETRYGVSAIPGKAVDPKVLEGLHDLDAFVQSESEQSAARALSSVSAISGIASSVGAAPRLGANPAAAAASFSLDDSLDDAQMDALRTVEGAPAKEVVAPAVAPVAAAPAAPATKATTADSELESLLADLG